VIYSMWLDDLTPLGERRTEVRRQLDESLLKPPEPALAEDDPRAPEWGLSPEQIAQAEATEAVFAGGALV
jgi:hypothetical protein